ncbi:peptidase [Gordonia sp. HY285]|uniref:NTF2-like N-terminal transpeptidase domain-containing protein n=1 Tax=Gordonia liuliyuniae TaxID=2911517 RepID=UPI001F3C4AFF|nr:NTF2-like N-terminal transpeptidase domain-containing protein [Gordonia liuliyuniae]MCF8609331.1 peptidase [Gordonia liuliyuniae]
MVWRGYSAAAAAVAAAVALTVVTGCGSGDGTDVASIVGDFASAIGDQDVEAASGLTTAPAPAAETLGATFAGMGAKTVETTVNKPIEYSDGTASFTMKTTWVWPGQGTFETDTSGTARELSSGWKVQWEPGLVYPDMPAGSRLQKVRTDATPAPTVDSRTGKVFMKMEPVNEIVFDPKAAGRKSDAAITSLAHAIEPIAPLITAPVIRKKVDEAGGRPVTAVVLRDPDMKMLAADPEKITGVTVDHAGKLVMDDRRLSSPLEDGLTNYWTAVRDATAGWQVQLVTPGSKPRRLAHEQGPPAKDIPTTVDQNEQLVLGDSVVDVAQPATMMTFDASTGGILAMAQNDEAARRKVAAGTSYATGSTLDPVFGAIDRATRGDSGSADDMLYHFGLGVKFTAPGVSLPRGTAIRPKVSSAQFKPNDYQASMLNMGALGVALARASAGETGAVAPYVIKGATTKVTGGALGQFTPEVARDILQSMTQVAKTGDASDLTGAPGLRALVGTNGPQGPGWFVGLHNGKVLVIYCEGDKSGTAALQVAQKYFTVSKR